VNQETRWYLIDAIMTARSTVSDSFTRRHKLSFFSGTLAGFVYQGLISNAEQGEWHRKMISALGWEAPDLPPAGVSRAIRLEGDDLPSVREPDLTEPAVLRSLPGSPDVVRDFHGSRFSVTGLDICDTRTVVQWEVSPEPDVASLFPDDFDALDAELVGVDDWAVDELRENAREAFIRGKVYVFQLTDDIGTHYQMTKHMGRYGSEIATGEVTFKPTVPDVAAELVVTWHEAELSIPLT
jgi:hypothetical protein